MQRADAQENQEHPISKLSETIVRDAVIPGFRLLLCSTLFASMLPLAAYAEEKQASLQGSTSLLPRLEALGFENLALDEQGESLTVWYENRRYFLEIEAMGHVLREALPGIKANRLVIVVPQRDGVPLMSVGARVEDLREFLDDDLPPEAFRNKLVIGPPPAHRPKLHTNSSLYRADLDLTPGYFFMVDFKGWINGTLRMPLADGLSATARGRFYLAPWGETDLTFAQFQGHRWLWPGVLGSWVAGRWDTGSYGAHGEIATQLDDGNWVWRLSGGAGTGLFPLAATSLARRFHPLDVVLTGGVGLFREGDRAVFARVARWFPRSTVEATALRSDLGLQFRLGLSINLGPDPLPHPSALRIYPGVFSPDYRASSPRAGSMPYPEADTERFWRRLSPRYIRAHVEEWR